jgi:hypothetical protein
MPIVHLDSKFGKVIGFTSDRFETMSYLWVYPKKKTVWISFIMSIESHKGYLRSLFDTIEEKGYKIIVPTPFPRMEDICLKRGMVKVLTNDNDIGETIEIMVKQ